MTIKLKTRYAIPMLAVVAAILGACGQQAAAPPRAAAPPPPPPPSTPDFITVPGERIVPESLTSTADGTVYFGSVGARQIYRAAPKADTAEVFIPANTNDMLAIFGVLADEKSG
ncbi:MAG: hypothetical protein LBE59_05815, partial [Nevskiaceae bacterium]|nr:hypothetical protein [Nevskiaceae bacterium]